MSNEIIDGDELDEMIDSLIEEDEDEYTDD
jgi:hypothetical protein